jgi:hypothetical protein
MKVFPVVFENVPFHTDRAVLGQFKQGRMGRIWAACPDIVTTEESESESENDDVMVNKLKSKKLPATVKEAAENIESSLVHIEDDESSTDDKELLQQMEDIARLQREVEQQSLLAIARAARLGEKEQKRTLRKQDLARQMQLLKDKQTALSAPSAAGKVTTPGSGGAPPPLKSALSTGDLK